MRLAVPIPTNNNERPVAATRATDAGIFGNAMKARFDMKKSKDGTPVREMVAEWLRANHYDGLCNPDGTECDRLYCTSISDKNEPSDSLESVALDMYREIIAHDERHPDEMPPADDERAAYGTRLNALGVAV